MALLQIISDHMGDIAQIITCAMLLIKPLREKILGLGNIKDGLRCLLRSEITRIYYRHKDDKELREYEFKNMEFCYRAYKALGGNSFIDHIYAVMQEWENI